MADDRQAMNQARSERPPGRLTPERPAVIVGAGPAGLTAAYDLVRRGGPTLVVEQDTQVGGLARTIVYRGFRFDLGGHRFFTKVKAIDALWREMLGADFLRRPRLSRILYRGRFFDYPLKPWNVIRQLGLPTTFAVLVSYLVAHLRPVRPELTFADWVTNRFGRRLFRIFFKTYTEKVWGIPCDQISAKWAAQRIKGLSIKTAAIDMCWPRAWRKTPPLQTLIHAFDYPRLGPGMMWERFAERVTGAGGHVELGTRVVRLLHQNGLIESVDLETDGRARSQQVGHVISTMPVAHLVRALTPQPPSEVLAAAALLKHRDFLTVALIVDQPRVFDDTWIYVHDEGVRLGRVQNYKNWSPDMVPDPRFTCLGLEYFVNEHDDLWRMDDAALVEFASREIARLGLVEPSAIVDGTVVRMPKAYPVYDAAHLDALDVIERYLARFENLQLVGRNGMHKYNNQDHSMLTALLAVRNLFGARHDLWRVNDADGYHEEPDGASGGDEFGEAVRDMSLTQPLAPAPLAQVAERGGGLAGQSPTH